MARILALLGLFLSMHIHAEIRILTFASPPLVNFHKSDDIHTNHHFTGFSVDLIDKVFNDTNSKYSIQSKPIKRALYETKAIQNTCTFPIDRTQDREAQFKWIGPVAINRYALYSAPNTPISLTTLIDAKTYTHAVYSGTAIANYLRERQFHMYETKSLLQGLRMLLSNRVDLWVADTNSAKLLAEQAHIAQLKPELIFFTSIGFMACNNETPNADLYKLDMKLKEMYQSGEAQRILHLDE
ncbi:substrate-binding periplasmic protein [Vibrio algarum]|uniref:Transporter substrate-binding domain-containing protein n=1 Tax=Vibrio algarum TaxID=3020714 RepID=A0ABT4YR29_9VIBR|nr:transporter substrate-binding domain-containing protein [Vibrio sp. KJ40-1]MDB1124013.1 transporter substrate-binding domain-containing protein [Vibrio sp. KJ40-1]